VDQEKLRQALLARRAELRTRAARVSADLRREREPLTPDFADQAIQRGNDDVLGAIGESAEEEGLLIERALRRLDDGRYGICVSCGGPIAPRRLEAVPHAERCAGCAGGPAPPAAER
jgi:RNA polymerase-binding transcription factor DksA